MTWPTGTALTVIAAAVSGDLKAIWVFDNAAQVFRGFSPIPNAPNDFTQTTARAQPVFICVTSSGTLTRPAP